MLIRTQNGKMYLNSSTVKSFEVDAISGLFVLATLNEPGNGVVLGHYKTREETEQQLNNLCSEIDKVYNMP